MPLDPMPAWVRPRRAVLGDQLRNYRRAAGLSQIQLGERIGRDHKTIHRWETAITDPTLTDLILIADAIGVPLGELVY
ncbi:helix-turn-helix transcriptional regulator [Streptomyces sp. NPDC030592]|uniref:helix-turn-helix domain-containing protein n=1 Tax=Streptomyces sp. NPDC030592 TaxID=3155365 RepID=UPI003407CCA7